MTIIEALRDPALFGGLPAFRDLRSWTRWLVFLSALYALRLTQAEERIFCEHTGRTRYAPPDGGYREAVAIVGRQSGKTRISGTLAGYEAVTAPPEPDATETYALLGAQDQRAVLRSLFAYACAPFERVPVLARSVRDRRSEALALENGCVLAAYPCRPAAVRGLRARVVVLDELAFYRSSEGYPVDAEMLRAARPCLATTGGRLVVLSSPYAQSGALYDLHRRHFGRDGSETLVWQGSAPAMNPTLAPDYLRRMEQDDPEAYRSEVLGEFRAGVSTFLDADALAACVPPGIRERPPLAGATAYGHIDAASGTAGANADDMVAAVARSDGERAVLVAIRRWRPPFNPSGVIAEAADFFRRHGVTLVTRDAYAPGFVDEACRAQGLDVQAASRDTSTTYLELQPLINAGRVSLLDDPELLRQLRALERRRGFSGRDRVTHAPHGHDDMAAAAAAVLVQVGSLNAEMPLMLYGGSAWQEWQTTRGRPDGELTMGQTDATDAERLALWKAIEPLLVALDAGDRAEAERTADAVELHVSAIEQSDPVAGARVRALLTRIERAVEEQYA